MARLPLAAVAARGCALNRKFTTTQVNVRYDVRWTAHFVHYNRFFTISEFTITGVKMYCNNKGMCRGCELSSL